MNNLVVTKGSTQDSAETVRNNTPEPDQAQARQIVAHLCCEALLTAIVEITPDNQPPPDHPV
jgi:hypothetical protein